jgi:maltose alpha-D-glucosyltransferase / alpha-amylase
MHLTLATDTDDPDFRPEPFSPLHRRSVYQTARSLVRTVLSKLREQRHLLPPKVAEDAELILQMEKGMMTFLRGFLEPFPVRRIRHHGNYHLQQVLCSDSDFIIIDFEGEPTRMLPERQIKRSPLRDVASMLQSFHYAVQVALVQHDSSSGMEGDGPSPAEGWGRYWQSAVSTAFLRSYFDAIAESGLLPRPGRELSTLLSLHLLERAVYELGFELDTRPDWVRIPIQALLGDLAPGRKAS